MTKTIIRPRGKGKTTELIKMSARSGDYIVCHSMGVASDIQQIAWEQMQLRIPLPITYDCFINKRYRGSNISGFLIDDVDALLRRMTHVSINAITLSEND